MTVVNASKIFFFLYLRFLTDTGDSMASKEGGWTVLILFKSPVTNIETLIDIYKILA